MKTPSTQIVLRIFLLLLIASSILLTLISNSAIYSRFNYWERFPLLEKDYLNSQYVNKHPKGWIPDEMVNAYAGGALIKGVNPIYIIPDTPPLGKYLIGLSAIAFNNENIIILLAAILSLFLMYLFGLQLFRSITWALIPPALFSLEHIFQNQLIYTPLYDVLQLVFLLSAFLFFNKALMTKRYILYFLLSNIALGLFISTKFFATGLTIAGAGTVILLIHRIIKPFFIYAISSGVSVLILLLSYIQSYLLRPDLHEFLGIQKWVFLYHKSQLILPFSIWPLMLLNKWYVWFGDKPIISDGQWQITWPLVTIFSFVTIILYLFKKIKHNLQVEVLMAWVIIYFLFFSFGQITSRYFVILIPILYLISIYGIYEIVQKKYIKRPQQLKK